MHAGIILFIISCLYIANRYFDKIRKTNIKLIESSVRVDIVAMPKYTIKELKNLEVNEKVNDSPKEDAAKSKPVEVDSKKEFLKKKKKVNFADMLKNIGKKKVKKKKNIKNSKGKMNKRNLKKLRGLVLEGNKLSKGEALVGSGNEMELTAFEGYLATLPSHVRPFWKLPSYLLSEGLNCRLQVFLSGTGRVLKVSIHESSGNDTYDNKAVAAVKRASPFPVIDKNFSYRVTRGDIILGFPL